MSPITLFLGDLFVMLLVLLGITIVILALTWVIKMVVRAWTKGVCPDDGQGGLW